MYDQNTKESHDEVKTNLETNHLSSLDSYICNCTITRKRKENNLKAKTTK